MTNPKHRSMRWIYRSIKKQPRRDNDVRKYNESVPLEDKIREEIRKVRDFWRIPYILEEIDDMQWKLPEEERQYKKVYYTPEDQTTIRELLAEDDAKFRNTSIARKFSRIRVPSLKRSDKEWLNFYRTWPGLAVEVAIGNERFADGAKLKYLPLFKQILDEEWPEDLKMWTEEQYDLLTSKGKIK